VEDNTITIQVNGSNVRTLQDILPSPPGLRVLFVAKTPAPTSVAAGHYFQGRQGRMFWNRLTKYGLLHPTTGYEDDSLVSHGFGITDIVKVPREFGNEPSDEEYRAGVDRILELIAVHKPEVVVFVYKRVLDKVLKLRFGLYERSDYGSNPDLDRHFGARVFVFPMPGTPCTSVQADEAMRALAQILRPE
jgi:G:T/U-mismatch repair DNA glycosylase